tara:strand:+ start:55 stop:252 length:198 start_codon:yes stop_codon:yes gene_type:complete
MNIISIVFNFFNSSKINLNLIIGIMKKIIIEGIISILFEKLKLLKLFIEMPCELSKAINTFLEKT